MFSTSRMGEETEAGRGVWGSAGRASRAAGVRNTTPEGPSEPRGADGVSLRRAGA